MSEHNTHNFDEEPNLPFKKDGKDSFGVPSDYFSSFEERLKLRLEAETELVEFSILNSIKKTNSFTVPQNYFSDSETAIEQNLELSAYTQLSGIEKPVFADLEEEYIQQFSKSLNHKVELAEELRPYQTLFTLDKINPFFVSDTYFDTLSASIKDRIHAVPETKVSVLDKAIAFIFGKKIALSFGLALVIGVSVYVYQPTKTIETASDCKTLACLERQEILNSKAVSNFNEEQLMELINVNSLKKQLNSNKQTTDSLSQHHDLENIDADEVLDEL